MCRGDSFIYSYSGFAIVSSSSLHPERSLNFKSYMVSVEAILCSGIQHLHKVSTAKREIKGGIQKNPSQIPSQKKQDK